MIEFLLFLGGLYLAFLLLAAISGIFSAFLGSEDDLSSTQKIKHNILKPIRLSETDKLLKEWKEFFDTLFSGKPLTEEQRTAALDDNSRQLVIASAGSGKTTTIIAKCLYLISAGKVKGNEILILSFNRSVKEEIRKKLSSKDAKNITIETFHSLGNDIIQKASGKPAPIDPSADEDKNGIIATQLITRLVKEIAVTNPGIKRSINEFRLLCPHQDFQETLNEDQYKEAMISFPRSGKSRPKEIENERIPCDKEGLWVRSQEEQTIVNLLFIKGIKFEYEKQMPDVDFTFQPDFYYPDIDLWHEHFAIRKNNTSYFGQKYIDDYKRKIETFKQLGIKPLITYSYEFKDNTIEDKILNHLTTNGIEEKPLTQEELERQKSSLTVDGVYKVVKDCIKKAKTNNFSSEDIDKKYYEIDDQFRVSRFKKVFIPIFQQYQHYLQESGTIDFEDMINQATRYLEQGDYHHSYKYILVDEFQDTSKCRSNFINALLTSEPDTKLFTVGDDWQSIYRFTGSDISSITNFSEKFPAIEDKKQSMHKIQETFRTCEPITKIASDFIQKNPDQIEKEVRGRRTTEYEQRKFTHTINFCKVDRYDTRFIKKVVKTIPKIHKRQSVYILARVNKQFENIDTEELMRLRDDLSIDCATIHKAKGLERDIVIVLGLEGGMYGFPGFRTDDPLVSIFLPPEDKHQSSEERRVMYVAMTRARKQVYILNSEIVESEFVKEIENLAKKNRVEYKKYFFSDQIRRIRPCQKCKKEGRDGWLIIRRNEHAFPKNSYQSRHRPYRPYNIFLSCNKWDRNKGHLPGYCDAKISNEKPCPKCNSIDRKDGQNKIPQLEMVLENKKWMVTCYECDFKESIFSKTFRNSGN